MPEQGPIPSIETPNTEADYRPLSGLAVAAIFVAGAYILLVLGTALVAISQKRPALNSTLLVLPVIGIALAIAARVQIKRSEGARIGLRLSGIAWWLCVVGGIGFGAYYGASYVALRQQSEKIAADWFDLLKKREVDRAFYYTIPPQFRQSINPAATAELEARFGQGQLPGFRNSELARFFKRSGDDVTIEPLGLTSLEQIDNGYKVDLSFAVRSPEGRYEVDLSMTGMEGPNFNGREWQVTVGEGGLLAKGLTEYGWLVNELEREALPLANSWLATLQTRQFDETMVLALPEAERPLQLAMLLARRMAAPLPLLIGNSPENDAATRAFKQLSRNGFFVLDPGVPETAEKKELFRQAWMIGSMSPAVPMRYLDSETSPAMSVTREAITYTLPLEIRLPGMPIMFARGRMVLAVESKEVVEALAAAKARCGPGAAIAQTPIGIGLNALPPRHWRVVRLESNLEPLQVPSRPVPQ